MGRCRALLWSPDGRPVVVVNEGNSLVVLDVEARFTAETRTMFTELFPDEAATGTLLGDIGRDFAFALMTGVALQRLHPEGRRPASDYVDVLKAIFRLINSWMKSSSRSTIFGSVMTAGCGSPGRRVASAASISARSRGSAMNG